MLSHNKSFELVVIIPTIRKQIPYIPQRCSLLLTITSIQHYTQSIFVSRMQHENDEMDYTANGKLTHAHASYATIHIIRNWLSTLFATGPGRVWRTNPTRQPLFRLPCAQLRSHLRTLVRMSPAAAGSCSHAARLCGPCRRGQYDGIRSCR